MMLIALLTRSWMALMEKHNVTPRTLADDLMMTAQGPNHLQGIIAATEATHRFLELLGAKVATNKSVWFDSQETTSKIAGACVVLLRSLYQSVEPVQRYGGPHQHDSGGRVPCHQ